jgi:esterase/lipase superfamily enzyme
MGTTYRARDPVLDRAVVVKVFSSGDEELRDRVTRSARAASKLQHRNIATTFEVGEHDGQPFIVAEFIQGETLAEIIRRHEPLSLQRKIQIVEDVSAALDYAHRNGMVHRDITPSKIIVTSDGVAKILDFGAVHAATTGMTQSGMIVGTLNYLSPEQLRGTAIDGRSDVFALGAVLYEFITYQKAFPGDIATGVFQHIIGDEPAPAGSVVPAVPAELDRIIDSSLKKEPSERYADAEMMRRDLSRLRQSLDDPEELGYDPLELDTATVTPSSPPPPASRSHMDSHQLAKRRNAQIEFHVLQAQEYLQQGRIDDAIAACERALIIDPDDPRAVQLMDRARAAMDESARLSTLVREHIARARQLLEEDEYDASLRLVSEALALDPGLPEAKDLRRRVEEAADSIRRASEESQRREAEGARYRAEEESRRQALEERRQRDAAEEEGRRRAEAEARNRAEAEARRRTEEEVQWKAEAEAKRAAEGEAAKRMMPEVVPVFYATDRARIGRPTEPVTYGSERSLAGLAYGCTFVSIPPGHRRGHLERPSILKLEFREDSARHVVALKVTEYTKDTFFDLLRKAMAGPDERSTFVFIHGFNVEFNEAVRRTAQLGFDLGLRHAPILYSWPSQGNALQYIADTNAAMWTVPHLAEFLRDLQEQSGATSIHLIAHSMGNQALTGALRMLRAERSSETGFFKQVVLTAPDLDAHVFERDLAPQIVGIGERTTLYASSRDEVLSVSKRLNAYRRAGDAGEGIVVVEGVDSIDASQVSTGLGHSAYGDVRTVVEDLSLLLRLGLAPGKRNLVARGVPPKQHWAFPA